MGRFVYWNFADINDYKKFPAYTVKRSGNVSDFNEGPYKIKLDLPDKFNQDKPYPDIEDFLREKKTVAFIIIRNDSIIYENYAYGYSRNSIIPSFSVSKVFLSALTGTAIQEKYIKSIDQPVTDFLPNFKNPGFDKISLENLLNMRSGINYNEGYFNPFRLVP